MSLSSRVKEREGYVCQKCGYKPSTDPGSRLEAHHIVPSSFGGEDSMQNMVALCRTCHDSAPTEVVPKSIVDEEKKVSAITVQDNDELREFFEDTFESYVSTGVPPTTDILIFGMMYMEREAQDDADLFEITSSGADLFETLGELSNSFDDLNRQLRNRESSWLMAGRISGYLDSEQSASGILAGEEGQLRFDIDS